MGLLEMERQAVWLQGADRVVEERAKQHKCYTLMCCEEISRQPQPGTGCQGERKGKGGNKEVFLEEVVLTALKNKCSSRNSSRGDTA